MSRIVFVPSESLHKHGVQDVTSEFIFFMMNPFLNSCSFLSYNAVFGILRGSKGTLYGGESNAVCPIKIGW